MTTFLMGIAIRSFVILLLTTFAAALYRQRSAAVVHRIWTLGLIGCLLVPIVTLTSPAWELAVLPTRVEPAVQVSSVSPLEPQSVNSVNESHDSTEHHSSNRTLSREASPSQMLHQSSNQQNVLSSPIVSTVETESQSANTKQIKTKQTNSAEARSSAPPLSAIIYWTWLSVAGLLTVLGLFQWIRAKQMLCHCQSLDCKRWQDMQNEVCDLLGVGRRVTLISNSQITSPMVTGIFRSWLIVPQRAQKWTDARIKMVLLHELAHVKRHDLLTHTIASVACAVNWFNPLAWYARRRMQTLREIACDDQVVTHCKQSADYADTLLDVARTCRSHNLAMTVAMARTHKVERRIVAILDSARNRTGLKRSSALLLVAVFGLLVGVAGSLQLKAIAQSPAKTLAQTSNQKPTAIESNASTTPPKSVDTQKGDQADPVGIRKIQIRVLDEKGNPLANTKVARIVRMTKQGDKFPDEDYQTNERGEVEIKLPKQFFWLALYLTKHKYVGKALYSVDGDEIGELIPDSYEFRLQPGKRLSGSVVDTKGDPIVGAKVTVSIAGKASSRLESKAPTSPKAIVTSALAYDECAAVTNNDGQWEILNAPTTKKPEDYKFNLGVKHPDFEGHWRWNERKREDGVATSKLRGGTAKLVVQRGLKIRGRVQGANGEPVTKGLVIWTKNSYFGEAPFYSEGVYETEIDATGRYESLPLKAGTYPVTVLAPGYTPQQTEIKLDSSSSDLDFELKLGNRLELQFVDSAGDPVPNVGVGIQKWRGNKALYNDDHSCVPNSGIPRKTDATGRYVWKWAPDDAVSYRIWSKGFASKTVALVARDQPHRIVMDSVLKIYGSVTDKSTGKPIEEFSVIPVKAFSPDRYSTNFQTIHEGKAGKFEFQPQTHGQTGNRYMVRIEAQGYRTAFSTKSIEVGDPPLHEDFALEPAPALAGKVIGPNGKPATKFTVAVGTATTSPDFGTDRQDSRFGIAFKNEDGSNEFQLPATFERRIIRMFNDDGFAEIVRSPDEPLGTIRLLPWGRVSGRLMQGDKAISKTTVSFAPLKNRELTDARFQDSFYTITDSDGRFQFDRLPPTKGLVGASLGPWKLSELTSSQQIPIDLQSGEYKKLQLGINGRRIVGKIVAKGRENTTLSKQWSLNYLISRQPGMSLPAGERPLELTPSQTFDTEVLHSDDFDSWLNTKHRYFVKLADDGTLQIDGVPPGDYDLVIQLYEEPSGCLVETIGERILPVTVTADGSESKVHNIGEIEVQCRKGPRVGSDMRAFEFVDVEGRQRVINDMNGQFVLFHVWASWCNPCLQTMPNLKAAIESRTQSPLTVVGLNIDEDSKKAKQLAKTGGWNWAMDYVGPDSAIARQLAISSAPAYFLVGPDGKLVMSSNQWNDVQKNLNEVFENTPTEP